VNGQIEVILSVAQDAILRYVTDYNTEITSEWKSEK